MWLRLATGSLPSLSLTDLGTVGGANLVTGTHTFFPAIAVNAYGHAAIGFAASASTYYPSSFFVVRTPSDPAGYTGPSLQLRAGVDWYFRDFGAGSNRWGDYSGMEVDPTDQCFWVYNQHAITRGTPTGTPPEDGRWGTAFGRFCACDGDASTGDPDSDGICSNLDNCPFTYNPDQLDSDLDGVGDACDICLGNDASGDPDADGLCSDLDNCPGTYNPDQLDGDLDGFGDPSDICLGNDASGDGDGDHVCADRDCDDGNPAVAYFDGCGVCGGDNSTCGIFWDGFELGNTSAWSSTLP